MLYRVQHETKLSYTLPVFETVFEVRMAPPSDDDQTSLCYRLKTTPQAPVTSYRDGFGNRVDLFNLTTPYRELIVLTTSFVRTHRRPVLDRLAAGKSLWPGRGEDPQSESVEALEFLQPSPLIPRCPELDEFVNGLTLRPGPLAEVLQALMTAVANRMTFEKAVTRTKTDVAEALRLGKGVCQDFTQVFIGACRAVGIPARYVSGYVNHSGELATHAWCQAWGGDSVGWVDIDPTHSEIVGDDHVTTAIGRDYHDVPPNRGLWKGRAEETISVSVKVDPVDRVPMEWNDWVTPTFRASAPGQFQRQSSPSAAKFPSKARPAYPNQPGLGASLVNQQSEQQQQSPRR